LKRALTIAEVRWGADNINVADYLTNYAVLLRTTGRKAEANAMAARARPFATVTRQQILAANKYFLTPGCARLETLLLVARVGRRK
jgi:hypothetical protein